MRPSDDSHKMAVRSQHIVAAIRPLLAGAGPEVQGAVLLDLMATWLAGHHPDLREHALSHFMAVLPRLVEINEKDMFGEAGFPHEGLS